MGENKFVKGSIPGDIPEMFEFLCSYHGLDHTKMNSKYKVKTGVTTSVKGLCKFCSDQGFAMEIKVTYPGNDFKDELQEITKSQEPTDGEELPPFPG